jgi:ethanolamine-phosphate phospho-lyase
MQLMDHAKDMGSYMMDKLIQLQKKHDIIGDVRGVGMFIGIDLVKDRNSREPNSKAAEHALSRFLEEKILMQVVKIHENSLLVMEKNTCFLPLRSNNPRTVRLWILLRF